MNRNLARSIVVALAVLTSPLGCVPPLVACNAVNPMLLAFLADVTVRNTSDEPLWITPVGTVGPKGIRTRLPLYMSTTPAIPAVWTGGFELRPRDSLTFTYDWDDINFSESAVRDQSGRYGMLTIDRFPTQRQYHSPAKAEFEVSSPANLESISSPVRNIASRSNLARSWRLMLLSPIPVFLLWVRARLAPWPSRSDA